MRVGSSLIYINIFAGIFTAVAHFYAFQLAWSRPRIFARSWWLFFTGLMALASLWLGMNYLVVLVQPEHSQDLATLFRPVMPVLLLSSSGLMILIAIITEQQQRELRRLARELLGDEGGS